MPLLIDDSPLLEHTILDRLPLEIYVEIFSHCPTDFPQIGAQVPPLTLALVCKAWYYLVVGTPCLWSRFDLALEGTGSSQQEQDETKKRLLLWLHRSRQQPLSFRIIHDRLGVVPDFRSAELLELLLPHSSRWKYVYFRGPGANLVPLHSQRSRGSLRALKSISLQLSKPWDRDFDMSRIDIPWPQLSALDLQFYQENVLSFNELFNILSVTQKLTSCTLNVDCSFSISHDTGRIVLPSLRSLTLIIQGVNSVGRAETNLFGFLDRLSLTDLQALQLEWLVDPTQDGTGPQQWAVHSQLTRFIQSSASSLEHLGFAYLPLRDHEIIACLKGLKRLRRLDLKYALISRWPDPITDVLLQYLTPEKSSQQNHGSTDACLPLLRVLKLQCSGEYLNQFLLLALAEDRAAQELKELEIFTLKCLTRSIKDGIRTLKSQGLNFTASTLYVR